MNQNPQKPKFRDMYTPLSNRHTHLHYRVRIKIQYGLKQHHKQNPDWQTGWKPRWCCFTSVPVGGGSTNRKPARRPAAQDRKPSVLVLHHNSATRLRRGEDAGMRACRFLGPRPNADIPAEAWQRLRPGVSSFIDPYWQRFSLSFFCWHVSMCWGGLFQGRRPESDLWR